MSPSAGGKKPLSAAKGIRKRGNNVNSVRNIVSTAVVKKKVCSLVRPDAPDAV